MLRATDDGRETGAFAEERPRFAEECPGLAGALRT
jgi:hypothetical protein